MSTRDTPVQGQGLIPQTICSFQGHSLSIDRRDLDIEGKYLPKEPKNNLRVIGCYGETAWFKPHPQGGPQIDRKDLKVWFCGALVHREGGPAIIKDLNHLHLEAWVEQGRTHRIGGPALTFQEKSGSFNYANGSVRIRQTGDSYRVYTVPTLQVQCWFQNGLLHREDGPAITITPVMEGLFREEFWFLHGVQHRDSGPSHTQVCEDPESGEVITHQEWRKFGSYVPGLKAFSEAVWVDSEGTQHNQSSYCKRPRGDRDQIKFWHSYKRTHPQKVTQTTTKESESHMWDSVLWENLSIGWDTRAENFKPIPQESPEGDNLNLPDQVLESLRPFVQGIHWTGSKVSPTWGTNKIMIRSDQGHLLEVFYDRYDISNEYGPAVTLTLGDEVLYQEWYLKGISSKKLLKSNKFDSLALAALGCPEISHDLLRDM